MIHVHQFPAYHTKHNVIWTVYAPRLPDEVDPEDVAKFVHKTMQTSMKKKRSSFSMGFMPIDWVPIEAPFQWDDVTYVVVTKDDENLLETLPELVRVENKMTLFVIPNHIPANFQLTPPPMAYHADVIADSTRIFFCITIAMILFSYIYANFINKEVHLS